MRQDRYGLPVSTTSSAALEAYTRGVDCVLSANDGAEGSFERAVALDPSFALAHIGLARSLQLQAKMAAARSAAARARTFAGGLTPRERGHVEALGIAVDGDADRALAAIRAHLADFPRDAMVLAPATGVYGLIGFSSRQDRNELLAELLDGLAPAYGDDWWFLGTHGFALTEARGWTAGAPLVERSLALWPRNAHAAHAHAHVLYERGGDREGGAFVDAWLPAYPRTAQLHCHLSWHLALFELGVGRPERAWTLYVESIRPGVALSPPMPKLCDAASFLWRSELAGANRRPEQWKEVAAHAERSFPRIGLAFTDAHCAVAFAAAGDTAALEQRVAALRQADTEGRLLSGTVLPLVAEALAAFARGDWESAIERLAPEVERFVRIGGSRAQRDLFENTLLAAYFRAGRPEEAAAFLARRIDRRPSVPVTQAT
ncbi:MAG TPA: tetratricopeptide repeat protein [Candidatus Methylomirabilis sp.]|nr:tetratricopeptide repeat protein [Candidatus Methylomirabilis sp.]